MVERSRFIFDERRMSNLGFSEAEIVFFRKLIIDINAMQQQSIMEAKTEKQYERAVEKSNMVPLLSSEMLARIGLNEVQAARVRYMYAICTGKVDINSKEALIKHLKKMFGDKYRIGITDLALSKVSEIPRNAVVAGINEKPFDIWNSSNYTDSRKFFKVESVSGKGILVETAIKPVIKYGTSMKLDGVLEIKEVTKKDTVRVSFNKKYCRLCNRFIVVASFRMPEYHHGCYELLCFEGTRVYVYAKTIGVKESARYNNSTERVYEYGFLPKQIQPKLLNAAKEVYVKLRCVDKYFTSANSDFNVLDPVRVDDEVCDDGIED